MRNNQSKKSISKSILVIIITITILALSGVTVYAKVIQPKKFEEYMQQGYVYLEENKYEEAVLSFEKAIKMDKKNIKAKVMAAESCIKINQIQKAGTYLLEAQDLDLKNEDLTLYLINMVKTEEVSILISSHILSEIQSICDNIIFINKHSIIKEIKLNDNNNMNKVFSFEISKRKNLDKILKDGNFDFNFSIDGDYLNVQTEKRYIPSVNAKLVELNIPVYGIKDIENSIEDKFIEFMEGDER